MAMPLADIGHLAMGFHAADQNQQGRNRNRTTKGAAAFSYDQSERRFQRAPDRFGGKRLLHHKVRLSSERSRLHGVGNGERHGGLIEMCMPGLSSAMRYCDVFLELRRKTGIR
jgi:hypothetical protein